MAFKEAARRADPVLLEPMMAGRGHDARGLHGRRHRRPQLAAVANIQAMEERGGARLIKAVVPLSEMFGYVGDLRVKTQGRASYSMQFDSYAEVPRNVADEIIEKARGE